MVCCVLPFYFLVVSTVLSCDCPVKVLVLLWYCLGNAVLLSWYWTGNAWYRFGIALVMRGIALVMPGIALVLPWYCPGIALVMLCIEIGRASCRESV